MTVHLTPVNDGVVDLDQTVLVTATAAGVLGDSKLLTVIDSQTPTLTLAVAPATITEGAPAGGDRATVTVLADFVTDAALSVTISTPRPNQIGLPSVVQIPPNEASVTFEVVALNNQVPEVSQQVEIAAAADSYLTGTTTITVADDDLPTLTVSLDSGSCSEAAGAQALLGTVRRAVATNVPLTVRFSSSDPRRGLGSQRRGDSGRATGRDVLHCGGRRRSVRRRAAGDDHRVADPSVEQRTGRAGGRTGVGHLRRVGRRWADVERHRRSQHGGRGNRRRGHAYRAAQHARRPTPWRSGCFRATRAN